MRASALQASGAHRALGLQHEHHLKHSDSCRQTPLNPEPSLTQPLPVWRPSARSVSAVWQWLAPDPKLEAAIVTCRHAGRNTNSSAHRQRHQQSGRVAHQQSRLCCSALLTNCLSCDRVAHSTALCYVTVNSAAHTEHGDTTYIQNAGRAVSIQLRGVVIADRHPGHVDLGQPTDEHTTLTRCTCENAPWMRLELHKMTPAPSAAVVNATVRGSVLQHDAACRGAWAAQLPVESASPAHRLHGVPPQPEDTLAVHVDLSKPILTQVLLVKTSLEPIEWPQQAVCFCV